MIASLAAAYARYRDLAERALAQVDDADLHVRADPDGNSLDVLVRHVGGNLRSRFVKLGARVVMARIVLL